MPRPPRSNSKTRTRAIELRKELTPAERKLWAYLRNDNLGVSFRRQHAIGKYIKVNYRIRWTSFGRNM